MTGGAGVSLADQPRTMGIFSMTLFAVSAMITLDTVATSSALGVESITLFVLFARDLLSAVRPDNGGAGEWLARGGRHLRVGARSLRAALGYVHRVALLGERRLLGAGRVRDLRRHAGHRLLGRHEPHLGRDHRDRPDLAHRGDRYPADLSEQMGEQRERRGEGSRAGHARRHGRRLCHPSRRRQLVRARQLQAVVRRQLELPADHHLQLHGLRAHELGGRRRQEPAARHPAHVAHGGLDHRGRPADRQLRHPGRRAAQEPLHRLRHGRRDEALVRCRPGQRRHADLRRLHRPAALHPDRQHGHLVDRRQPQHGLYRARPLGAGRVRPREQALHHARLRLRADGRRRHRASPS